jgi:hypothetical protein
MTKPTPGATTLARRARRARKEIELAAKIRALPERRYGLMYADPPCRFEPFSQATGLESDASNHYPVMTLEKIKALGVPSIAASQNAMFQGLVSAIVRPSAKLAWLLSKRVGAWRRSREAPPGGPQEHQAQPQQQRDRERAEHVLHRRPAQGNADAQCHDDCPDHIAAGRAQYQAVAGPEAACERKADEVRARRQPEGGEGARARYPIIDPHPRR